MKIRRGKSLSFQVSVFLLVMVVLCAVLVGISSYVLYRNDNITSSANRALAIAQSAAGLIEPEEYKTIMQNREKNDYWYQAKRALDEIKVRTDVKYLYVLDKNYDDTMTYFAEGYNPLTDIEEEYDFLVEEDIVIDGVATYADEMYETLSTGEGHVTDVYDSGDFGSMVSGFAAIKDANGQTIGVVGADIGVDEVITASNLFALRIVLIILGFCVLAAFVSIRFTNRRIGSPISVLTAASDKMAEGDVEVDIHINRYDEIGILAQSFQKMAQSTVEQVNVLERLANGDLTSTVAPRGENDMMGISIVQTMDQLNHLFEDIKASSDQVSMAAEQISTGAQNLAGGSTQQAATLEEFSDTLTDVLHKSEHNATQASTAYEETMKASQLMRQSMESMNNLYASMQEIISSSENIARVIKVVDDIAFQTNILALNAAVEAARAGQHGKGFAVVADEVRSLAAKSAQAAKETTTLIQDNIQKVDEGAGVATQTQEMLQSVDVIVSANATTMEEINSASAQQNQAISEITEDISQLSDVVQANSATAEESAATAEEMSSQSQLLNAIVGHFRLRSDPSQNLLDAPTTGGVPVQLPAIGQGAPLTQTRHP